MIMPVLLNLVIVIPVIIIIFVIVPMIVCLHDLMIRRALIGRSMIVRAILRADQRRGQAGHRESRESEQCGFPKVLAHGLSLFRLKRPC